MTNNTKKIKKMILAIEAAPAAIPPKPNRAAINAIIKKIITKRNILLDFKLNFKYYCLRNTSSMPNHALLWLR